MRLTKEEQDILRRFMGRRSVEEIAREHLRGADLTEEAIEEHWSAAAFGIIARGDPIDQPGYNPSEDGALAIALLERAVRLAPPLRVEIGGPEPMLPIWWVGLSDLDPSGRSAGGDADDLREAIVAAVLAFEQERK